MELTKQDTKMTKGLAIIFMVILHLFCRKTDLPYSCIKLAGGVPLVYYIGLMGDCCVAIYCFCSGYALEIINQKQLSTSDYYLGRFKSILKLMINFWIILVLFSVVGLITHNEIIPGSLKSFVLNVLLIDKYNGAWWFLFTYSLFAKNKCYSSFRHCGIRLDYVSVGFVGHIINAVCMGNVVLQI